MRKSRKRWLHPNTSKNTTSRHNIDFRKSRGANDQHFPLFTIVTGANNKLTRIYPFKKGSRFPAAQPKWRVASHYNTQIQAWWSGCRALMPVAPGGNPNPNSTCYGAKEQMASSWSRDPVSRYHRKRSRAQSTLLVDVDVRAPILQPGKNNGRAEGHILSLPTPGCLTHPAAMPGPRAMLGGLAPHAGHSNTADPAFGQQRSQIRAMGLGTAPCSREGLPHTHVAHVEQYKKTKNRKTRQSESGPRENEKRKVGKGPSLTRIEINDQRHRSAANPSVKGSTSRAKSKVRRPLRSRKTPHGRHLCRKHIHTASIIENHRAQASVKKRQ